MNIPELDKRTAKDILAHIKKVSKSYTPEWKFDEDNPDVGTALSVIYANMMADTLNRFNKVLELNRLTFFNKLGAKLLPAIPAKGYVTFSLVNDEVPGVEVKKGTRLYANAEDGGRVPFETVNDLYVTGSKPEHIYLADSQNDKIIHLYNREEFEKEPVPFYIFDIHKTSLQKHELFFNHDSVLNIEHEAWIVIQFFSYKTDILPDKLKQALLDPDKTEIGYYTEEGFTDFEERRLKDNQLWLLKKKEQPAFALTQISEKEGYFIRMAVADIEPFRDFVLDSLTLRSLGSKIEPDLINAFGIDQNIKEFYPFGERPSLFTELYFVSKEVLSKKGAQINLSFKLDYVKIPLDLQIEDTPVKWKNIMRRSDFKPDVEYDITIEDVSWEYYNGEGWSRLFINNQYSKLFTCDQANMGRQINISFCCPDNISPFLINSVNSYSIRARILKMNNLYKPKGNYLTPVITKPAFKYEYSGNGLLPDELFTTNNIKDEYYNRKQLANSSFSFKPFYGLEENNLTMYMGFKIPPYDGPIKILLSTVETISEKLPRMNYEYYANGRWQSLPVVDETENMRRTGLITMIGPHDFTKKELFGQELYWIRIIDNENLYYGRLRRKRVPCINGIYINSTKVEAVESIQGEYFNIEPNEENKVCTLLYKPVYKADVWINEIKSIHDRELKHLEKLHELRYDMDANGQPEGIWVKWIEVEDFNLSGPDDRHYVVDRINGQIIFSNGRKGKIPGSGNGQTILVEYSCGGGSRGNLPVEAIDTMNGSIGYINKVSNHEITTEGCDQETIPEAMSRHAAAIRHGGRAVMASDYEDLAMEASRNILSAKCIANCNDRGEKEYGSITLVVLQKDFMGGRKFFDSIRAQVVSYIGARMSGNLLEQNKFYVIEPKYIEINVYASITVKEFDHVFDVKNQVQKRLETFLNPICGNFDHKGWKIGSVPNNTQILNALNDIREIQFIRSIKITGYSREESGLQEIDLDREDIMKFILPVNGVHEIFVEVK